MVIPRFEAEGRPPDHRHSHRWFRERGLRSFPAALRREFMRDRLAATFDTDDGSAVRDSEER